MNIPTVDDLVNIFKENNWKPCKTIGCQKEMILQNQCCAIPAVVKFIDPEFDFNKIKDDNDLYDVVAKEYGEKQKESLYAGFDSFPQFEEYDEQFYNLGKGLWNKLNEQNTEAKIS
jgi:hypothetical protein